MGDQRFAKSYQAVESAEDRLVAIQALSDAQVVEALAHASREANPLLANVARHRGDQPVDPLAPSSSISTTASAASTSTAAS